MRAMTLGGLLLEDLSDETRSERELTTTQMALLAKHVGQYNEHAAAKKAGYLKDDVIVEFDGITERTTESELIGHLIAKYQPGEQVRTVVLRDGKRIEMTIPMQ
jgi:S1-C subfamily serine protease